MIVERPKSSSSGRIMMEALGGAARGSSIGLHDATQQMPQRDEAQLLTLGLDSLSYLSFLLPYFTQHFRVTHHFYAASLLIRLPPLLTIL